MSLTQQEQKVRRNWLIMFIFNIFFSLCATFINMPKDILVDDGKFLAVVTPVIIFFGFVSFFALYHFAYRKRGTKFLSVICVSGVIQLIYVFYMPFSVMPLPMSWPMYLISTILSVVYLYANYQLLKVNKRIKTNPM